MGIENHDTTAIPTERRKWVSIRSLTRRSRRSAFDAETPRRGEESLEEEEEKQEEASIRLSFFPLKSLSASKARYGRGPNDDMLP
jgi:hypothetical protein